MASDNNTLRKDLGPVSAYAVAVAHGFDGTEAEWEQYIANASTKAAQASASATAAAQSEENAETAKEAAETAKVEAQTAAQSASAAYGTSLLAPNYSTEATYTVGQHVIYSGNLYSCITAITTPEAWDATHWTQVQVGNEVSDLKSAFDAIRDGDNLFVPSTATDGYRINNNGGFNADSVSFYSAFIAVQAGKHYERNAETLDIRHRIAVYDSAGVFLPGHIYEQNLVLIPEGGAFIRLCGLITEKETTTFKIVSAKDDTARSAIASLGTQVNSLSESVTDVDNDLSDFKNAISQEASSSNILTGATWESGWISPTSGALNANESYTTSSFIEVNPNKYIISSLNDQRCEIFTLAVYNSSKSIIADDNATGDGTQRQSGYFLLPSNAAFIRISYRTNVYDSGIVVGEHDTNTGYDQDTILVIKEQALQPVYEELNNIKENIKSKWYGKIMASYGDSQTNQNKWQPIVVGKLGMTSRKYGISGATIAVRSTNNTGDCLSSNYYLGQLDSFLDEEGFDIILIMGGTNDWRYDGVNFPESSGYKNIQIGENADTGNLTFKGALKTIVAHLQARYPSKVIALMSNIGGRSINDPTDTPATNMTAPLVNANGYTQANFAQATKEIAEYVGIPFIDVYSCGINIYNTAYYLQDGLHINSTTGAKKVADCVISGLENIQPYTD